MQEVIEFQLRLAEVSEGQTRDWALKTLAVLRALGERVVIAERERNGLRDAIDASLHRYDNPDEPHNKKGGFPRGELAWAMANDLRKVGGNRDEK